jgi:hypothetical protein
MAHFFLIVILNSKVKPIRMKDRGQKKLYMISVLSAPSEGISRKVT